MRRRDDDSLRRLLQIALPVLVVLSGAAVAWGIYASRNVAETEDIAKPAPLVEILDVQASEHTMRVRADGIVRAHTSTTLVAEVAGRVIKVTDSLASGSFFAGGEELVHIENRDYRLACIRAEAAVAEAQVALDLERAEADTAIEEWRMHSREEPPALVRRIPQLAAAEARIAAARADLERAEIDLERTVVRAPYAGRVRSKDVDVGQYVGRGTQLAQVYAIDYAEVRLPLQDRDLAFLDLPMSFRDGDAKPGRLPEVTLRADFAGRSHEWTGHVVRTEGELDPRSRMVHAIARIDDPYGRAADKDGAIRPPLLIGMFVEAQLRGRSLNQAIIIPRAAVRGENLVLVVDDENKIHSRTIDVLRRDGEAVLVRAGLEVGERVCTTRLEVFVDGMEVRIADEEPDATAPPDGTEAPTPAASANPDAKEDAR